MCQLIKIFTTEATDDDSGDGNIPTGSDQPLLPLTAAALGTSVLLAASSKREEREAQAAARLEEMQKLSAEDQAANLAAREASVAAQTVATVNEETPYMEVSTLAALAGVVKETFEGEWEDAVRISPADAPITIVTHNWVNGVDPEKRLQEIAENDAFIEWYYQNVYLPNKEKETAEEENSGASKVLNKPVQTSQPQTGPIDPAIQAMIDAEERRKAENIAAAAEKAAQANNKLTAVENETMDRNVFQTDSSKQMADFHKGEENSNENYSRYQVIYNGVHSTADIVDIGDNSHQIYTAYNAINDIRVVNNAGMNIISGTRNSRNALNMNPYTNVIRNENAGEIFYHGLRTTKNGYLGSTIRSSVGNWFTVGALVTDIGINLSDYHQNRIDRYEMGASLLFDTSSTLLTAIAAGAAAGAVAGAVAGAGVGAIPGAIAGVAAALVVGFVVPWVLDQVKEPVVDSIASYFRNL